MLWKYWKLAKNLANCCNSPNLPKFYYHQCFLLYRYTIQYVSKKTWCPVKKLWKITAIHQVFFANFSISMAFLMVSQLPVTHECYEGSVVCHSLLLYVCIAIWPHLICHLVYSNNPASSSYSSSSYSVAVATSLVELPLYYCSYSFV